MFFTHACVNPSDRGRVVGGLPDVVTIMEEKVKHYSTLTRSFLMIDNHFKTPCDLCANITSLSSFVTHYHLTRQHLVLQVVPYYISF